MKVICVDGSIRNGDYISAVVVEGNVYTVVDTRIGYGTDNSECMCYELEEIPYPAHENLFDCDRFIPLSEIDETELVNQKEQLQTA